MPEALEVRQQGETELVLTRKFAAPRDLVFDCFMKPELIQQWMFGADGWSLPVCELDPRDGGSFRYVWRHDSEADVVVSGKFELIERPARIVHREVFEADPAGGDALVTTEFEEAEGITSMKMTVGYSSAEAREGAVQMGATEWMGATYERLDGTLESIG